MEIKKSKFLGFFYDVNSSEEVSKILTELKKEHKKARHIAWAYVLSSPLTEKFSDDGEPSGTAGRPILNVLQKQNKKNCLVAVVRYFGGIKLGAGGLVRAYTKATVESLSSSQKEN